MKLLRQSLWNRRSGPTTAIVVVGSALLLSGLPLPAPAVAGPNEGRSEPVKHERKTAPRPMYWGAWIGDQLTGTQPPWDMSAVHRFEALVGKGMSLLSISSPFADCSPAPCSYYEFPAAAMDTIRNHGAIPFFNWASHSTSSEPSPEAVLPDFQLSDVIAGTYDPYIREFAEGARNWGHPFFLRFNWEMNGDWFPWSESVNGNQPGQFVAAWRHVHDVFTSVGATNATWVWCPYAEVRRRFAPLRPLYPGAAYVDWTCMDGFNWAQNPANPHPWRSFDEIFSTTYRQLVGRVAPDKPIVLAEMASTGSHRSKAAWIRNMFKALAAEFPRIRGLIWFDKVDRGIDWPLETSPRATRAFAQGLRRRAFRQNVYAGLAGSPIPPPG